MSETLSQDPENLGTGYNLAQTYSPTPATPNSTVQDAPNSNLPPFSTFSAEMDATSGYSSDRLFGDTRLLDISSWDYYGETRLLERTENGLTAISSQPQYRPWESKPVDSTSQESLRQSFTPTTPITTFADAFAQSNMPKLPSFQSQFQSFNETSPVTTSEATTLTTLTNLTPVSPNSASPGSHNLTTLNTNFHTLSAVNTRNYPLVPAPIQAREIPSIQQQFLDERHIQLYTHPTTSLTTLGNTIHSASIFPAQNGTIIQNSQLITPPTVVTVLKSEPASMSELKLGHNLANLQDAGLKIQNVSLHPTQFQNPMSTVLDNNVLYNGLDKKLNGMNNVIDSPTRNDFRKKERRKMRANSMESSAESDGASSNMEMGSENSGQVASVSSTAGYKGHPLSGGGGLEHDDISGGNPDKQVKKKRKRCGECIGCQRKDNCGDCAPCRNDKSHQICKQRRCEKLTEKKLYGEDGFVRGESRRGRGKGRSAGSYRGRKPSGPVSLPPNNAQEVNPPPPPSRPSPQPVHMLKPEQQPQSQPMTPVPFYADPNRFTAPVWQADPAQVVSGWPQGQFIQQISAAPQAPLEGYTQQYPNGIYQTTYQQPGFETNTFYTTGPVQVVTNAARPPSVPEQSQLTPRPNSTYSHTPSPVPSQSQQPNQRNQYQQEYVSTNQNYVTPATTPGGTVESSQQSGGMSRPSSVNSTVAAPASGQTFQQSNAGFIPISSSSFSPGSNQNPNFVNSAMSTNSGNEMPGYPPVNSHPQLASHNYNGGYPGNECGNENIAIQNNQNEEQQHHHHHPHHHHHWTSNNHQWKPNSESAKSSESDMQNYGNNSPLNHRQSTNEQQGVESPQKRELENQYSQIDRIDLNTRIKTMILNKQQQLDTKDEAQNDNQNKTGHFLSYSHHRHRNDNIGGGGGVSDDSSSSSHKNSATIQQKPLTKQLDFFSYPNQSNFHYDHPPSPTIHECLPNKVNFQPQLTTIPSDNDASSGISKDESNTNEKHYTERILTKNNITPKLSTPPKSISSNYDTEMSNDEKSLKSESKFSEFSLSSETESNYSTPEKSVEYSPRKFTDVYNSPDILKTGQAEVIPECNCFPSNMGPPEPGSFYTHLGSSHSLSGLRKDLEERTGLIGSSIRIEKVCYSGKEGKTPQGCPIAKWIIRRSGLEEKYLVIVKHRQGHFCSSAFIIVCIVVWEGLDNNDADDMYSTLCHKLNKFGTPTARRCGTNDTRTCACQGLDPDLCGASFSFGCSWSMYYNGCKYARSKLIRKFKLTEQSEEKELEEKFQALVNHISPMYKNLAPKSFENQCQYEETASECRLGLNPGRPFSGVTACLDFCAHAHKDSHNMNNGCTVVVSLTKHRDFNKPEDEQLHVLPLYTIDKTDEFGSEDRQRDKINDGSIEVLNKYQCEVRVRNEPQQPCRRRKRKDDGNEKSKAETPKKNSAHVKDQNVSPTSPYNHSHHQQTFLNNKHELQSDQVTSTVFDASNRKHGKNSTKLSNNRKGPQFSWNSSPESKNRSDNDIYKSENFVSSSTTFSLLRKDQFNTAFNFTYPNSGLHSSVPPSNGFDSYNFNAQPYQMAEHFSNINPNQNKNTPNIFSHTPTGGQSYHCNNISCSPVSNNYPNHENGSFIQNGPFSQNGYFGLSKLNYMNDIRTNTPNNQMLWGSNEYNGYHHNGFNKLTNNYFPYSTPRSQELQYGNGYISSPPDSYVLRNPFEDFPNFGYNFQPPFNSSPLKPPDSPKTTVQPKLLGTVSEVIDNAESFLDSQVGGVAIALTHGSILFECAKHELHATTALKNPNRQNPTRISLVFYQHRNMNRAKHGWDEYEEKLKLRKMDSANLTPEGKEKENAPDVASKDSETKSAGDVFPRVYTLPTVSVTTLFPMYPCTMTGPYVNGSTNG